MPWQRLPQAFAPVLALALPLIAAIASPSTAAPVVDPGFGTGGVVTNPGVESFTDVIAMPDGGVVAVGDRHTPSGALRDSAVVRVDRAGQPHLAFGDHGVVTLTRSGYTVVLDHLEHGPRGTLVAFGGFTSTSGARGLAVARIDATTGHLDPTFAAAGMLLRPIAGNVGCGTGTVLPDGRLLGSCWRSGTTGGPSGQLVLMVDAQGRPVASFGTSAGTAVVPQLTYSSGNVVVGADGRIVLAAALGGASFGAIRLLPSGAPDTSFGRGGIASRRPITEPPGSPEDVWYHTNAPVAAIIQSGGRVVVAATINTTDYDLLPKTDIAVVRFTSTGASDPGFNSGTGATRIPRMSAHIVTRAPDSSLLIGGELGYHDLMDPLPSRGKAAHLSPSGVPDTGFGPRGTITLLAPGSSQTRVTAVAAGTDGRITMAGASTTVPPGNRWTPAAMLLRYTTPMALPRAAAIDARLSHEGGLFLSCGASRATACRTTNHWSYMGSAWPLEAHDPPRVVIQLERRNARGAWIRATWTTFITDAGNFRASGDPRLVGDYRVRAAIPASASTALTYAPWRYFTLERC